MRIRLDDPQTAALHESFADLTAIFLAIEGHASYLVGAHAFSDEIDFPNTFVDQSADGIPQENWMRYAKNRMSLDDATNVEELSQVS